MQKEDIIKWNGNVLVAEEHYLLSDWVYLGD